MAEATCEETARPSARGNGRRLVHITTVDMSLELLLGPQLRAFVAEGFEVVGISAPGPYVAGLEADGIRHIPLPGASRSWSLRSDLRALWSLYRLLRELKPDIVHTHNPKPGVYGRIAAKAARVPRIVNTVHGLYATPDDPRLKRWLVYGIERLASTCSDVELFQNSEDLALMRDKLRIPADKAVYLGNGVDLERFDADAVTQEGRAWARRELGAKNDDDVVIGFVGRLVAEKGIPELLEAAEIVMTRCPNARFALIGMWDDSRNDGVSWELIERAEENGVRFLGERNDVEALYPGMDIFVLPSHREGFPRSVMEAAAMGVPAVVTDVRGCREAVSEGVNGALVPVLVPRALGARLARLAAGKAERDRLAAGARDAATERFDSRQQTVRSIEAYS